MNPENPENSRSFPLIGVLTQRKIILLVVIGFSLFFIPFVFLLASSVIKNPPRPISSSTSPTSKTWEITFTYDSTKGTLAVKKIKLLDKTFRPDTRVASLSPYELSLLTSSGKELYKTKIQITEQITFNIIAGKDVPQIPSSYETTVYIPHYIDAKKIQVHKNGSLVLEAALKDNLSFHLVSQASAQSNNNSCGPATVVFISDNYSDLNQYHTDANNLMSVYNSTPPYAGSGIFDFKIIDNTIPLGCNTQGIISCIQTQQNQIESIALSQYPTAAYAVVLVNSPNAAQVDQQVLGVANGPGGREAVFTNRRDIDAITPGAFNRVAIHEFLGHSVGALFDRYIYSQPPPSSPNFSNPNYPSNWTSIPTWLQASNCTDNPQGEAFWKSAGVTSVYPRCVSQYLYASSPQNCSRDPLNGGNTDSIMSKLGCGSAGFDAVESYWIKNNRIPEFQNACQEPTATPIITNATPTENVPTPISQNPFRIYGRVCINTIMSSPEQCEPTEAGFPNATIELDNGQIRTTITSADGSYSFDNVRFGQYTVRLVLTGSVTRFFADRDSKIDFFLPPSYLTGTPGLTVAPSTPTSTPSYTPTPSQGASIPTTTTTQGIPTGSGTGEEPLVFYDCQPVTDTQTVNGKTITISWLRCCPEGQSCSQ